MLRPLRGFVCKRSVTPVRRLLMRIFPLLVERLPLEDKLRLGPVQLLLALLESGARELMLGSALAQRFDFKVDLLEVALAQIGLC